MRKNNLEIKHLQAQIELAKEQTKDVRINRKVRFFFRSFYALALVGGFIIVKKPLSDFQKKSYELQIAEKRTEILQKADSIRGLENRVKFLKGFNGIYKHDSLFLSKIKEIEFKLKKFKLNDSTTIDWIQLKDISDLKFYAQSQPLPRIECNTCHGEIQEMEIVEQASPLTMGWCIDDYHRKNPQDSIVVISQSNYYDLLVELHAKSISRIKIGDIDELENPNNQAHF